MTATTGGLIGRGLRTGVLPLVAMAIVAVAPVDGYGLTAAQAEVASPWVSEHAARIRLIAGGAEGQAGRRVYAGLEIQLDEGWKTYWRNPGYSGVPPRIDIEGSENVAKAELLFPAPRRFKDVDGDTIGYRGTVVLPVELIPEDASKPIRLRLNAELGICREVCVPIQPSFSLEVPAEAANQSAGTTSLSEALARVPQPDANDPGAPRLERVTAALSGPAPEIVLEVVFPDGSASAGGGDVFLEAPDGMWIPLPKAAGTSSNGTARFVVDLTDGADVPGLAGRPIRATLVSDAGQAEASFKLVDAR